MKTLYNLDIYTLGTFALCCIVLGVFLAAAIGGWLERRKLGRRPFVVNPSPDMVITDNAIYMTPITAEELKALLRSEHDRQPSEYADERQSYQDRNGHRLQ